MIYTIWAAHLYGYLQWLALGSPIDSILYQKYRMSIMYKNLQNSFSVLECTPHACDLNIALILYPFLFNYYYFFTPSDKMFFFIQNLRLQESKVSSCFDSVVNLSLDIFSRRAQPQPITMHTILKERIRNC